MSLRFLTRLALAWMLALAVWPAAAQLTEVRRVEGIVEYALPNGLTVLLQHEPSKPTTTVNLTYRVGSRHEGYGESGAAHLLEHLLFKATAAIEDPKLEMTRRGARWNGTTSYDRTNYFAQFGTDPELLAWMLRWLSEAMTGARLLKSDLESEMTVVRNEMERAENSPGRILLGRMRSAAYQWHGYGREIIGARSDVENMPIERLRAFYRKHYRPDNAVLVIGGNFDATAVRTQVEHAFGPIPKPAAPIEATWTREPPQDGERQVVLRRQGGNTQVALMYQVMPGHQKEFAALRVLARLLANDEGPLGKQFVEGGPAASQWAGLASSAEPGSLMLGLTLRDGPEAASSARQAVAALAKLVEALPLDPRLVDLSRREVLQQIEATLRNPESLSLALSEAIALGDWRLIFAMRDWAEAVRLEDVQAAARTWLLPANRTAGLYLAESAAPARAPVPPDVPVAKLLQGYTGRAQQAAVEDFAPTPANIEARLVKSQLTVGGAPGLKLAVLPRKAPGERVTGTLRLRWGTAESVRGQVVAAGLVGQLLLQGTDRRSATDVQQALLALEAQLRIGTGPGGMTASFEVPAQHLEAFLELASELLQQASFPEAAFERARNAALAGIAASLSDPSAVAGRTLQRVFSRYEAGDPREARSAEDTRRDLQAASAQQVRAFWRRFGGAGQGELALVGPVQPAEVQAWAQKAFGGWRSAEPQQAWSFKYPADLKGGLQTVRIPDKANANYLARIPLDMHEDDPEFPALYMAVNLLGGRPGTALWQRVREQEGLSYGVGASLFAPGDGERQERAAAINIHASFAPENNARLRAAIHDELKQRAESGFNTVMVGFARRAIVSGRADYLAQHANIAGVLANNLRWGRDMQRYARFTEAFDKLDAAAVNAALKTHLRLDRLVEVEAGSFREP